METTTRTTDPVCGMEVDPATAAGSSEYRGQTYHFCSRGRKARFDEAPRKYAGTESPDVHAGHAPGAPASDGPAERVDLPITGMTCAACARRIETKLAKAPGVRRAGVNFATHRATVEYDPGATGIRSLMRTVEDVGSGTTGTATAHF